MVLRFFAFALTAAALIFGCADIERDGPYDEKGTAYNGQREDAQGGSSSSDNAIVSSSSLQSGNVLCVIGASCVSIPAEACNSAGTQVSICQASNSSSSSIISSSSSRSSSSYSSSSAASSSSLASSSSEASSSSVASSSAASSSSSAPVPSSSSIASSGSRASSSSAVQQQGKIYGSSVIYQGETYETVVIGTQTWFARNLNYNATNSKCYDNLESNCDKYGRLYNWATAMALPSSCNSSDCASQVSTKHQGVCPSGWHLPSNDEWDALYHYADGTSNTGSLYHSQTAGRYLKATSWYNGNGQDTYGFAALPGGRALPDGSFADAGETGYWWSTSEYEYDASIAYYRLMGYLIENAYWSIDGKSVFFSIRCVKD